ncbi:TetR/AcrR family transcriptional regulator [Mumia sp. DW29H23]|uniref:TetR/AcrR family transcriptional regulator n=1 Tax=Mumia sp. DW29H23 TaxID=3421241 RepID=UPI003D68639A
MSGSAGAVQPGGERSRTGRPPLSERQKRELRAKVARAAVRLFAERGVSGTTGDAIARAVGISSRTLWRHFPTKESCVRPFLDDSLEGVTALLRSWPADVRLVDFLRGCYAAGLVAAPDEDVLTVLALVHTEPSLRAVWLDVHEDALPVFAEILARRCGRSVDSLEVKVHAATVNGALRAAVEHYERTTAPGAHSVERLFGCLDAALDAAARGLPY